MSIPYEEETTAAPQWYEMSWLIIEPKTESTLAINVSMIQSLIESDTFLFLDWNSSKTVKFFCSSFWASSVSSAFASDCWLRSLPGCLNTQRSPNEQYGNLLHTDLIGPRALSAKLFTLLLLSALLDCGLLWECLHAGCTKSAITKLTKQATLQLNFKCSQSLMRAQQGTLLGSVCHPISLWWFRKWNHCRNWHTV